MEPHARTARPGGHGRRQLSSRRGSRSTASISSLRIAGWSVTSKSKSVPSPYNYALMLPQSDTERLLEERLQRLGVSVERGTEATALKIGADGVEATLRHADGREETAQADWLGGCDGAHSIVRHTLGAPFTGETMLSDWVLADTHMSGYPFPDTEIAVYWARDGVLPIFPIAPGRYRIIANVPPSGGDHPRDPTLEEIAAIVEQRGPKGVKLFDPIWLSGFKKINARKVASYRSGQGYLSGDAAHVHSPAGGEGMNTRMQDAFNLAWKLASAIHGTCGEALLDTYSPERRRRRRGPGTRRPDRHRHPAQSYRGRTSQSCRPGRPRFDAGAARCCRQYVAGVSAIRKADEWAGIWLISSTARPRMAPMAGRPPLARG